MPETKAASEILNIQSGSAIIGMRLNCGTTIPYLGDVCDIGDICGGYSRRLAG